MHYHISKVELLSWDLLKEVPSASAMVKSNDGFYIIGDDSPYLFHMDTHFQIISKTAIYSLDHLMDHIIPKVHKPDFEAMVLINDTELLIFGSGSKSPERDVCIKVSLGANLTSQSYNLKAFYELLRGHDLLKGFELDLEGVAFDGKDLHLFNRGRNVIFSFSYSEFIDYCTTGTLHPAVKAQHFILSEINGLEAGFSDATYLREQNCFVFTAAVENAPNAYDDGEIVGSFLGLLQRRNDMFLPEASMLRIPNPNFPLKIEAITVDKRFSDTEMDLILATDNDGAPSQIIKLRMTFQ